MTTTNMTEMQRMALKTSRYANGPAAESLMLLRLFVSGIPSLTYNHLQIFQRRSSSLFAAALQP
jgi:hypothetical protein